MKSAKRPTKTAPQRYMYTESAQNQTEKTEN